VATTTTPIVARINVVYLYVRDVSRSLEFYRGLLGIPLEGDDSWAEATFPGGTRFAVHALHERVGEPSSGTIHLDFEVADVDSAVRLLRDAGVEVGETIRDEWGAAIEVVDPDGYRVFLFQPPSR
jgi:catechol 2,3-dioxygenase-like lactoylglutathione lyase family enzyme